MALAGAMRGFARDYPAFSVAMFLFGSAVGLTRLNFPRALSQWFPSKRLGMVNGISGSGAALGSAVSMGVSAGILGPLVGGWRNIVILLGVFTLLLAVLWILLIRERISDRHSVAGMTVVFKGLTYVLRSKTIWVLSFISLLLFGHAQSWTSHMPGFFETAYDMTNAAAGRLVSISLFGAVFASIIGPTISDRIGLRKRVMLVACVVGGVTNILQGSFLGPVLIIILIVMTLGVGSISPLLFTVPFELRGLRPAVAGSAVGMIFAFQNLGAFIYPILSGKLIDLFGPNYYPYFFAQSLAFAVIFILVLLRLPETGSRAGIEGSE
jgi:nitrate/nitrite transporter NarK